MKRLALASVFVSLGAYAACAVEEPVPPGNTGGGTALGGASGTTGQGGAAGTAAGTTSLGGAAGTTGVTGGTTGVTGGTTGVTGGTTGVTGGAGGDGTQGGSGGAPLGGTGGDGSVTGGAGGAPTGGAGGMGGVPPGGAGPGGAGAGPGGAGAGGAPVTIGTLFPPGTDGGLDGFLITIPCNEENSAGTDCVSGGSYWNSTPYPCSGGRLDFNHTFPVGGVAGTTYQVVFHMYGIMEPKIYGNGLTKEAGTGRPGNQDTGAVPTGWATAAGGHSYPVSDYNTYEFRVWNNANTEVAVYYMNADTRQGHWTYVTNFEKTIPIIGGGQVRIRVYDNNCREIKNCGIEGEPATDCAADANARRINVSAAMPTPPNVASQNGGLLQPQLVTARNAASAGQWWLIDAVRMGP